MISSQKPTKFPYPYFLLATLFVISEPMQNVANAADLNVFNDTYDLTIGAITYDNERIGSGSGIVGTFNQSGGANSVNYLLFVGENGGTGTYNLSAGMLNVLNSNGTGSGYVSEWIGLDGQGTFNQTGGANTTTNLGVGAYGANGNGTYNLSGNGSQLTVNDLEFIGFSGGTGAFTQTGGIHTVSQHLMIGNLGGFGTYTLSDAGSQLIAGSNESIGLAGGAGIFNQDDGSHTVGSVLFVGNDGTGTYNQKGGINNARNLTVGWGASGNGIYNLSAGTLVDPTSEYIGGNGGTGQFNQSGGTNTVADILFIGNNGGTGTYNLSAGTLNVLNPNNNGNDYEWIGMDGKGTFNQTGGTNNTINLALGSATTNGDGTYNLSGANSQLAANNEWVGTNGTGEFNQSGGANTIYNLIVGRNGNGTYNLSGGTLDVLNGTIPNVSTETIGAGNSAPGNSSGIFNQTGGVNSTNHLQVGQGNGTNNAIGIYSLSSGSLNVFGINNAVAWEQIGIQGGTGIFDQTGGTHTTSTLAVGAQNSFGTSSSNGTYTLSGASSQLTVTENEMIGWQGGTGTFNQIGGTHSISKNLNVGNDGNGAYNLSGAGSQLSTIENEAIGLYGGIGFFNQDNGTNTVGKNLVVGFNGNGTYTLSGDNSQLNVINDATIGYDNGIGTFNQHSGTNTVNGILRVGTSGIGTYNLSGDNSQLIVNNIESIGATAPGGNIGLGTLNHTGGTNTAKVLYVGGSGNGTYNLNRNNSQLIVNTDEFVGKDHSGTFNQFAGTHTVGGQMTISVTPGTSSGTYNLDAGTLTVANGIFNNGTFNYNGGNLNADLTNNNVFTLSGAGTRTINGDVVNDGTIKVTNTNVVFGGTFTNNGAYISDPSTQYFNNLVIGASGYLQGGPGDKWVITGDFTNESTNALWDTSKSDLEFAGTGTHVFEFAGVATWNSLDFSGILKLEGASATLNVGAILGLSIDPDGLITNLQTDGMDIHYDALDVANSYLSGKTFQLAGGGSLVAEVTAPVPEPTTMLLFGAGIAGLAAVGRRKRS